MKIGEVFCGCGGFGALATNVGHEVVLGIDNDEVALDCWGVNNPGSEKRCVTLPPLEAIKWPDVIEHLHFSSPCQSFSGAKRGASGDEVRQGNALLCWSVQTALEFGRSWSLENVACARSKAILDEFAVQYPDKIAYVVIDAADFGVPQNRTRLLAGPPLLIKRLKELPKTRHVTLEEAFATAGLEIESRHVANTAQLRKGGKPCTRSVTKPAFTALTRPLRWHFGEVEGPASRSFSPEQMAAVMSFPPDFKLPKLRKDAFRVIGNAVPPLVGLAIIAAASGSKFEPTLPPVIEYAAMRPAGVAAGGALDERLAVIEAQNREILSILRRDAVPGIVQEVESD